jgi:SAM-dependent methyltransferase
VQSWSEGYVSEVGYTYGLYNELNPLSVKLAFAIAGLVAPDVKIAAELGFGQGVSVLLYGASSRVAWYGNDFKPAHAGFANELADAAQAQIHLTDESFAEFCARSDIPDFDFIGLHGIWSWINQENRDIVVDFVRRKLRVGGVLYMSYNALPGWSASAPLRHLMSQHDQLLGAPGHGVVKRVEDALGFVQRVFDTDPLNTRLTPSVLERFVQLKQQNRHYLAQEFFNRNWQPFNVSDVAQMLAPAKLDFACSANFLDTVDGVNLTDAQQSLLDEITDPILSETLRDMMVNASFRKDYWVKGARKLGDLEHRAVLRGIEVVLMTTREEVPMKVTGALGEADLSAETYDPLLAYLGDHRPHGIGAIADALPQLSLSRIIQAVAILANLGALTVGTTATDETRASARRINLAICQRAISSTDLAFLASPVTGGGVPATRFHQLFLLARAEGHQTPADWARYAWTILSAQNQLLVREGRTLPTVEENVAVLTEMAETFARGRLPMLEKLEVF